MKTQTSKTLKLALAAAAALLAPVLAGANPQHQIWRSAHRGEPAAPTPASSQYQFVTIDATGASETDAIGVNNPGQVTGFYLDAAGNLHAFLWQNGGLQTVDFPGAPVTQGGHVNDVGLMIGNYGTFTSSHAAVYHTRLATWITLPDIPGYTGQFGGGINNSGVGAGAACNGNAEVGTCVGWTWDGGAYSSFTDPEADQTQAGTIANGINNIGQVVGHFQDAGSIFHGFLKNGDQFTTIDAPAALSTFAIDINDGGEIVGFYLDTTGTPHGFVRSRESQLTTFDVPGAVVTVLYGNDDRGDLSGLYVDQAGNPHGFVAFRK
jgi:probable HAF family extracellular repeat protein